MKIRQIFISFAVLIIAGATFTLMSSLRNYDFSGFKKAGKTAMKSYLLQNVFYSGTSADTGQNPEKGRKNNLKNTRALNLLWQDMGPGNIGGRVRAMIIDKDNDNLVIAGGVAGGLWITTNTGLSWNLISGGDSFENNCFNSACQTSNGNMYFGTGDYYAANTNLKFRGQGIYKSTDRGNTWTRIPSTWDEDSPESLQTFCYVIKLAADSTYPDRILAATVKGIRVSNDGGNTWFNPVDSSDSNFDKVCNDIQVSLNGQVVVASLNNEAYVSASGQTLQFVNTSGTATNQIPKGLGRLEFAIAPSDPDYVYALAADATGALKNVYQSTDKGANWAKMIESVSTQFSPFGNGVDYSSRLGIYCNVIRVFPDNPEHILLGGYNLFEWSSTDSWIQLSSNLLGYLSPKYIHSGIHTVVFSPKYSSSNKKVLVGSDGGVFRSVNGGIDWSQANKNLNITQFNSVAFSNTGKIIGGTQNNGTIFIPLTGTNSTDGTQLWFSDTLQLINQYGGHCEFSYLNNKFLFMSKRFGLVGRSEDEGATVDGVKESMYPTYVTNNVTNIGSFSSAHPKFTAIRLWENFYDTSSIQNKMFEAPRNLFLGDTIRVESQCKRYLYHIIDANDMNGQDTIFKGDTLYVQDTYQSIFAVGFSGSVWLTRQGLDMTKVPPYWFRFTNLSTIKLVQVLEFSADGDYLFFADYNTNNGESKVYRASNINSARDSLTGNFTSSQNVIQTQLIGTFTHMVTSIAVDPQNPNNLIVTLGEYDKTNYIYYSNNAATTTSDVTADNFTSKQGDLEIMPVHSSVIVWNDSRIVILGTETGIYATEDITASYPVWKEQNTGAARVPVLQLRQQIHRNGWMEAPVVGGMINTEIINHGVIYAATAGRGIIKCENFRTPVSAPELSASSAKALNSVKVYPNPVSGLANVSFVNEKQGKVNLTIANLRGNIVKSITADNLPSGEQNINFSTSGLVPGTYLITVETQGKRNSAKFIVN